MKERLIVSTIHLWIRYFCWNGNVFFANYCNLHGLSFFSSLYTCSQEIFLSHCTTVAMGILCPNIDTLFLYCLKICRSITSFHPFLCNVSEPCSFKIKRWCMWIVNNKIWYDDINWLIRSSVPALNSADYMLYFWKDVNLIILSLNFAKTLERY